MIFPALLRKCRRARPLFLGALLVLSGCSQSTPESDLSDYFYRLENVFGGSYKMLPPDAPGMRDGLDYPSKRQLHIDIPSSQISLLDFLRLSECDLQRLIGERNSSLGKVAHESQKLLYQLHFIQLAEDCLIQLEGRDERRALRMEIQQDWQLKRNTLGDRIWNATFAGPEFQYQFSLQGGVLSNRAISESPVVLEEALKSLQFLISRMQRYEQPTAGELESALKVIQSDNYLGRLLLTVRFVRLALDRASQSMEQQFSAEQFCPDQRLLKRGQVMKSVFEVIYLQRVQPMLANLKRRETLSVLTEKNYRQVAGQLSSPPEELASSKYWLFSDTGQEWFLFDKSISRHIQVWQKLLGQCGLRPEP